jgi:hypothetical protein
MDCRDKEKALKWCLALTPKRCEVLLEDLSQCYRDGAVNLFLTK